jgi:hypothetical protein
MAPGSFSQLFMLSHRRRQQGQTNRSRDQKYSRVQWNASSTWVATLERCKFLFLNVIK